MREETRTSILFIFHGPALAGCLGPFSASEIASGAPPAASAAELQSHRWILALGLTERFSPSLMTIHWDLHRNAKERLVSMPERLPQSSQNTYREPRPTECLRSDCGSELQSKRVWKWLSKEGIIFKLSAPYSQELNGLSERTGRTIIDMTRVTILKGNIDDDLWPEIVLAMTHVKNLRPTSALKGNNSHRTRERAKPGSMKC